MVTCYGASKVYFTDVTKKFQRDDVVRAALLNIMNQGQQVEASAPEEAAPDETAPDPAAPLPTPVQPVHGATAWGVYLAAAPDGRDPAVTGALERLRARGIEGGGSGDLGCDDGAAQALGLPPSHIAASVAFGSREDADRFVAAWPEPVLGVAEFTAYCRD